MNQALPLDEVIHRVVPPAHPAGRPYLQAIYDYPRFPERNVWRRYGGWWDGEPDTMTHGIFNHFASSGERGARDHLVGMTLGGAAEKAK